MSAPTDILIAVGYGVAVGLIVHELWSTREQKSEPTPAPRVPGMCSARSCTTGCFSSQVMCDMHWSMLSQDFRRWLFDTVLTAERTGIEEPMFAAISAACDLIEATELAAAAELRMAAAAPLEAVVR